MLMSGFWQISDMPERQNSVRCADNSGNRISIGLRMAAYGAKRSLTYWADIKGRSFSHNREGTTRPLSVRWAGWFGPEQWIL